MRSTLLICVCALACAQTSPKPYESVKLAPVDEGVKDPSLVEFRDRLMRALRERDLNFVISIMQPDIKLSFGGETGIEDFKKMWIKGDGPEVGQFWTKMTEVLSMGGKLETDGEQKFFTAPYTFTHFPQGLDAFESMVITGASVNVREKPDLRSRVIESLSYEVVRTTGNQEQEDWVKVVLPSGRTGYVSQRFARSPVDYRVRFSTEHGPWRMVFFLAGD